MRASKVSRKNLKKYIGEAAAVERSRSLTLDSGADIITISVSNVCFSL